jgi:hypothetical protein
MTWCVTQPLLLGALIVLLILGFLLLRTLLKVR